MLGNSHKAAEFAASDKKLEISRMVITLLGSSPSFRHKSKRGYGFICWRSSYLQTTRRVIHFGHYDLIFHIWNSWFASLSGKECFATDLGKLWRNF